MDTIVIRPICYAGLPSGAPTICYCNLDAIQDSCRCGEDIDSHEWAWDVAFHTADTHLIGDNRGVLFHPGYSSGTAAVRGDTPCEAGRDYYWEIKVLTPLYGTDVMVGVGTPKAELSKSRYQFCSLLGSDQESWGYSYKGDIQHNGEKKAYGPGFGHGSVVGVHLDMWRGTLQFYLNRVPLGVAFSNLKARVLYPMVCSTAAHSSVRLIYSFSCKSSLQLLCMQQLSSDRGQMQDLLRIPGFRNRFQRALWWLAPDPYVHSCKLANESQDEPEVIECEVPHQGSSTAESHSRSLSYMLVESDDDMNDNQAILQDDGPEGLVITFS